MKQLYTLVLAMIVSAFAISAQQTAEDELNYIGSITIDLSGLGADEPLVMDNQTVTIVPLSDTECNFLLKNFNFEGMPLGDIDVKGVKMDKQADGSTTYAGSVKGLELAGGDINADVDVNGTEDAAHNMTMKIDVVWTDAGISIPVTFNGKLPKTYNYIGAITIDLSGLGADEPLVMDNQTVTIVPLSDTECNFLLKNFNFEGMALGDIDVKGVKMTKQTDGTTTYAGSVKGLELAGGDINADVDVNGTEDAAHNMTMKIDVVWTDAGISIPVEFSGKLDGASSGIADIAVDKNVVPRYFLINGLEVNEAPTSGLYIELRGGKARKVLAK